jgi:hypothetical protein
MKRKKKYLIGITGISLIWVLFLSPALAGNPNTNIVDAMKASGFIFETARWTSKTTQEDESGKVRKSTQKFWISGRQVRIETRDEDTGETNIIIDDGNQPILYNAKEKTAMVMNEMMKSMYSGLLSNDVFKQAAENRKNAKTLGIETIHGKPCTIKEYENTIANVSGHVKEWIWNGKQFPMKSIVTVPSQTMTMMGQHVKVPGSRIESVVTDVTLDQSMDESLFKLPPGVKIETMGNAFDDAGMEKLIDKGSPDEK